MTMYDDLRCSFVNSFFIMMLHNLVFAKNTTVFMLHCNLYFHFVQVNYKRNTSTIQLDCTLIELSAVQRFSVHLQSLTQGLKDLEFLLVQLALPSSLWVGTLRDYFYGRYKVENQIIQFVYMLLVSN